MEASVEKKQIKIMGLQPTHFIVLAILVIGAMYTGLLPGGMAGAFPIMLVLGALFRIIGDNIPIVKDYLGGGSMVVLFGCAALVMFNIIPEETVETVSTFMKSGGFINLALAALIAGSVFGMNRKLLIRAISFYLPCIIGGIIVAFLLVGIVGAIIGYGFKEAILYIGIPIMGGGTSAGAVPLSQMYASILNVDAGEMMSVMTPAVGLGNAVAIVIAGLLDRLGKNNSKLSGNGNLVRSNDTSLSVEKEKDEPISDLQMFGIGIAFSMVFLMVGQLVQKFIPGIHAYAWMVIAVVVAKAAGIMPERVEKSCNMWYQFIIKNFTQVLLVGIGISLIDLGAVIDAISIKYLVLVVVTVVGAVIGSGLVGQLVGFYPIEAAITGGLCMANMGGSGDIATLGAANRMELMPFAAVSSRLGGSIILIVAGFLLQFFI